MENEKYSCCNNETEERLEVKEIGIYEKSLDTLRNLQKITEMLDLFKRELDPPANVAGEDMNHAEPTSFKDNVDLINAYTYGIKHRLENLIGLFR